MSEVPKTVEEAPVVEPTPAVAASEEPTEAENTTVASEAAPESAKEEAVKSTPAEAATEASPSLEGILGYKAPSLIPRIRFSEHFFWLSEEPCKPESLVNYFRSKEGKVAHPNAAWAQITGKGLLFFAKRAEDKSSPSGIINLSDISDVTKDGTTEFLFKAHGHKHVFQTSGISERDNWVAAIEKSAEEAKSLKDETVGSEAYKKHLDYFLNAPVIAGPVAVAGVAAGAAKHETTETTTNGVTKDAPEVPAVPETKKDKEAKSRSQSRKRSSIFGSLLGKKEEREEQKDLKKEDKKEEKVEKEVAKEQKAEEKKVEKEQKKVEKEQKKEEAKATHEPSKAAEAGAAAAAATVPAAAIAAEHKKEEKEEEPKAGTTTPTEKKAKRGSIFGSLFNKKDTTAAPAEKDAAVKDAEVPAVSENAPKLEEPIVNKPIDTAAVTAPVDTVESPVAVAAAEEPAKEVAPAETAAEPTKEKKGGFLGFIKKQEAKFEGKKEQKKEEKATEQVAKDPVVAAATTETPAPTTEPTTTPPAETPTEGKERRRSSFFGNLGNKKKATDNTSEEEAAPAETKRDKSPLPQRIGSLFRRPSKGLKSAEDKKEETAVEPTEAQAEGTMPAAAPITNGESAQVGDGVSSVHDAVTLAPEVKASA